MVSPPPGPLAAGAPRHYDALPARHLQLGGVVRVEVEDVHALVLGGHAARPLHPRLLRVVLALEVEEGLEEAVVVEG